MNIKEILSDAGIAIAALVVIYAYFIGIYVMMD